MVDPAPGALPVQAGMPSVPMVKSGEGAKEAGQDPLSKAYTAVFWSGAGQVAFKLDVVDDISAGLGAFFLALRQYPKVHTFAVWRMTGPNPEDVADPPIVYLALAGLEAACAKTFQSLTGGTAPVTAPAPAPAPAAPGTPQQETPPDAGALGPLPLAPVPLKSAEQGFGEMTKQMKDARRGGNAADPRR